MTYTYCGETTDLTDAEVLALVRHYRCCEAGEVLEGGVNMLRFQAGCDLAKGHSGPHAGLQVFGAANPRPGYRGDEEYGWLFWGGVVREVAWPAECPAKAHGLSCLLFDGHEGPHLHYTGEQEAPAWLSHECR